MKTLLTAEQFDNYPVEEDKRYELAAGGVRWRTSWREGNLPLKLLFA
jgi:hypothetical protein